MRTDDGPTARDGLGPATPELAWCQARRRAFSGGSSSRRRGRGPNAAGHADTGEPPFLTLPPLFLCIRETMNGLGIPLRLSSGAQVNARRGLVPKGDKAGIAAVCACLRAPEKFQRGAAVEALAKVAAPGTRQAISAVLAQLQPLMMLKKQLKMLM